MLSVILTVHNEGNEIRRTVASVLSATQSPLEILIVDDGSTDGCCEGLVSTRVRLIRSEHRVGIAYSRDRAVQQAQGDVVAFLDGHQRISTGALDRCAEIARLKPSIVTPDVRGYSRRSATAHGATFRLCPERGYFSARWRMKRPRYSLTRVTSLRAPAYALSRATYDRVRWIQGLRNWGASEAAISLKAFFLDIPLLHLCGTPTRHCFKNQFGYATSWDDVWRNQALIARVCFEDRTWRHYWLPEVFDAHLTTEVRQDLESQWILEQHENFQRNKIRHDYEFWTKLLRRDIPPSLR